MRLRKPGRCRRAASIPAKTRKSAAERELLEETGVKSIAFLGECDEWLSYDLPAHLIGKAWKGRYRGQTQKWFAYRFIGADSEINIAAPGGHKAEFSRWRWALLEETPALIVDFKRPVYEEVARRFAKFA